MATFKNVTGAKLIVNNEFGIPVCFEIGDQKSGLSNYLERFTSTYMAEPLLKRVGNLDAGGVPVAVIEEENMAVRPSAPNKATLGLTWGDVGGKKSAATPLGFVDPSNDATRLRRVGFNTESDAVGRQIDTRFLDVKPAKLLAINESESFDAAALDQGGSTNTRAFTLTAVPAEYNGRRATAADCANATYGSLLTEGQFYTAFGTLTVHDASGNADKTAGFAISGTTVTLTDATFDGAVTSIAGAFVCKTGVFTFTRTGGQATDTIAATVYYAKAVTTATLANTYYDADDAIRGWYEVSANTSDAGVLLCTDYGIFQFLAAGNAIVAWS